ncbi:hypothetical protein MBLNU230_g1569t1 [Neophaeotheca triangularis]
MPPEKRLQIIEHDNAGNISATYIHSAVSTQHGQNRIDVVLPKETKSQWQKLLDVFLPAGYPHSVTDDYLEPSPVQDQIPHPPPHSQTNPQTHPLKDSLQAFASSIASLLSSRAVLTGLGVGDATATATSALLLSTLQETCGRMATIAFAAKQGTALEPESKKYRLLADVLNDVAFVLDSLSPVFPRVLRVLVLSASSVLRALCGVAAGSAKASLSQHFARWGNLGELNAKDSSQETVVSLLGLLVGTWVVGFVEPGLQSWGVLVVLLGLHLELNRRAVRAVCLRSLSRQRAGLVLGWVSRGGAGAGRGAVPTPVDIARLERIFERDGVLRDVKGRRVGFCAIGVSMARFLEAHCSGKTASGSFAFDDARLAYHIELFKESGYLLGWAKHPSSRGDAHLQIVLKKGATAVDQLTAWWHALLFANSLGKQEEQLASLRRDRKGQSTTTDPSDADLYLALCRDEARGLVEKFEEPLRRAGWDLDAAALETTSSTRVAVEF